MEILYNIQEWLDASSVGYEDPIEASVKGIDWQLQVHFPSEDDTTSLAGFSEDDSVGARRTTGVASEHISALQNLSESEFRKFHLALKRDLLLIGVLFRIEADPDNQQITRVDVASRMYAEALDRAQLMENLQTTYNASLIVKARFQAMASNNE